MQVPLKRGKADGGEGEELKRGDIKVEKASIDEIYIDLSGPGY